MVPDATARLAELWRQIDRFFERVRAAHGASITCHAGCDSCCHHRFSVTSLEAELIRRHVAALDEARRATLRLRAAEHDDERCAALDDDGRCAVYDARPVICRTHGLALRLRDDSRRHLPVLDACPKNFTDVSLDALDASLVLDQTTLSTVLAALDAAHADACGSPRGARVAVADALG